MARIRILDDLVVNKIAAGEVVERPSAALKELLENALDAGATQILVKLKAGGRQLVHVSDDGCGMDAADALMCLERHGTSKIRDADDLFKIGTLGFRGEALPSIASVSRFELITRPRDADVGTRVIVDGGVIQGSEPVGCPAGTEINVRQLFFNVPVRRKFLRSAQTEYGHCLEGVIRQALIHPGVDWTVEHDGREALRAPATSDAAARARDLLKSKGEGLFPIAFERGTLSVRGLISPVGVHHASANGSSYLYVNGRYVRDPLVRQSVQEAYRSLVPKGRYPAVVLEIQVPREDVDVNIHPSKTEVKFRFARELSIALSEGIREALQSHGIRRAAPPMVLREAGADEAPGFAGAGPALPALPDGVLGGDEARLSPIRSQAPSVPIAPIAPARPAGAPPILPARPAGAPPPPIAPALSPNAPAGPADEAALSPLPPGLAGEPEGATRPPSPPAPNLDARPDGGQRPLALFAPDQLPQPAERALGPEALLPVPRFQDLKVIGQLAGTYLICEGAGEMVIVDQHAAHERVTLYRLQQAAREQLGSPQRLLAPVLVELSRSRAAALEERLEILEELNLEVEPYGGGAFLVRAVPPGLGKVDVAALVRDIADDVAQGGRGLTAIELRDHIINTMACHNSIRANQVLSHYEMREMLKALDGVDFSVCAHGRPVAIRVDQRELERRFHRS